MSGVTRSYEAPRTMLFVLAVAAAVVLGRLLAGGRDVVVFALVAVCIAIWHGAFDHALAAEALLPRFGTRWPWVFFPVYLALALGCMALWWAAPAVMLPLFLLYSAWHFGLESEPRRSPVAVVRGVGRGALPIVAACHWWPGVVAGIFAQMLRSDAGWSRQLTAAAGALLWPCMLVLAVTMATAWRTTGGMQMMWMVAELCLFRWCAPLVAFAVYFCLWHTPDHLVSTSLDGRGRLQPRRMWTHLRAGLWPWLVSLAAMGVAGWVGRHTMEAYAGVLFVALSALTVPHMVLAEYLRTTEGVAARVPIREAERPVLV